MGICQVFGVSSRKGKTKMFQINLQEYVGFDKNCARRSFAGWVRCASIPLLWLQGPIGPAPAWRFQTLPGSIPDREIAHVLGHIVTSMPSIHFVPRPTILEKGTIEQRNTNATKPGLISQQKAEVRFFHICHHDYGTAWIKRANLNHGSFTLVWCLKARAVTTWIRRINQAVSSRERAWHLCLQRKQPTTHSFSRIDQDQTRRHWSSSLRHLWIDGLAWG